MVTNQNLNHFLDFFMRSNEIDDASLNGLQVEGKKEIHKIITGVSANLSLFKKAESLKADAVLVHHGLFWKGMDFRLNGYLKKRVEILLRNQINLFAYHLPLDCHETVGNNISLLNLFQTENIAPFGYYHGNPIGFQGDLKENQTLTEILGFLEDKLEQKAVKAYPFGKEKIKNISVVSGGASSILYEAIKKKTDLFITGELTEYTQELCRETGLNYIALGHYSSEKLGVQNLSREIQKNFECEIEFIDIKNDF